MKKITCYTLLFLALSACNSQGEKRTKTVKAEPSKKEELLAEKKTLVKNIIPDNPSEPKIPELEKTVNFIPPKVTDERPQEPLPEVRDYEDEGFSPREDGFKIPAPPTPVNHPLTVIDENAEFPGGKSAMNKYLKDNLKYPETAISKASEGKTYIKVLVEKDGKLSNPVVAKKLPGCPECDEEALRLVREMPAFIPGKVKGKNVDSYFFIPVTFRLL